MSDTDLAFFTRGVLLYGCLSAVLHSPLWVLAYKWNLFTFTDLMLPFAAFVPWFICINLDVGPTASLANAVIEPLIAVALSLAIYGIRIASRVPASLPISLLTNVVVVLAVIAMRFTMPGLPE